MGIVIGVFIGGLIGVISVSLIYIRKQKENPEESIKKIYSKVYKK